MPPATKHLYQSSVTISSSQPTKTGYTFSGWNTDSTGGGLDYTAGNGFEMGADDIDLYAWWIKKKYAITFVGNDDRTSNVLTVTEYEHGSKIDSASVIPSRLSYTFSGWFKDSLTNTKWQYSTDSITAADTLYAKWVIIDVDGNRYTDVKIGTQGLSVRCIRDK